MKYLNALILALLLVLPSCQTYQTEKPQPTKVSSERLSKEFSGTVRIYCCLKNGDTNYIVFGGSGFLVEYRGQMYIATAKHVVPPHGPYNNIQVVYSNGDIETFTKEGFTHCKYKHDVSAAKVKKRADERYFKVDKNNSEGYNRFGRYIVIGYVAAKYPTVFHGRGYGYLFLKGFSYIVTDHAINYGVSGSAVLDHEERVIGIVSMKTSGTNFNGGLHVPVKYLIDILDNM